MMIFGVNEIFVSIRRAESGSICVWHASTFLLEARRDVTITSLPCVFLLGVG